MMRTLKVTEFFLSIQGESSWAGKICAFVRLTGCPLRCTWCDTAYAFKGGQKYSFEEIHEKLKEFNSNLIEITGGEPLAQPGSRDFLKYICDQGYEVLLETSGSERLEEVDPRVHIIMDLKCPDSKMSHHNLLTNLDLLKPGHDELKFVVASQNDFEWACKMVKENQSKLKGITLLASPVWGVVAPKDLVDWVIKSGMDFRLNLQQHKVIWGSEVQGV